MKMDQVIEDIHSVPKHHISERDVFCNRELNMKKIKAVGFDMDYTLAQYYSSFDLLAFNGAKEKLVKLKRYPESVLNFQYDPTRFTRGLVIDKQRGNIIKMDRHKYVRVAYHGFDEVSSDDRKKMYNSNIEDTPNLHDSNFVNMDTLFSVVDSVLFAHLVDLKDKAPKSIPQPYGKIFSDVRYCVDLCHRDGVIKDRVAENPSHYITHDKQLLPMLLRLKSQGIKTFLLTNSLWDYTTVVMDYLLRNDSSNGSEVGKQQWLDLFDVVIVGSNKPGFLLDPKLSLFRVDTSTHSLFNTNDIIDSSKDFLTKGKVFQGGNWKHLHELLELSSGENLLYVGDHMYSDILRSKRSLGWRTCLIVPELENEIKTHQRYSNDKMVVSKLREKQHDLDEWIDKISYKISTEEDSVQRTKWENLLSIARDQQQNIKQRLRTENLRFHHFFHPVWGQLFKSGYQDSHFAQQVSIYACLYTSRASNLITMSTERSFRPAPDLSVHDQLLDAAAH